MGLLSLFQSGILKKLPRRRPGGLERLLSSQIAQTPYLYLNEETVSLIYGDTEWDLAGRVVDTKLFDPRKEETVTLPNQVESSEQLLGSQPIGSSRGWLALLTEVGPDNESPPILLLTKKVVDCDNHLYTRLPSLPCSPSESILNVSLSSSSPEDDDDCIMAVKFLGPRFSFCRPALAEEAKWTHVYMRANHFDTSSMVYSNRHRKFYMTTQGSHYLAAWDLHTYPPVTTNYNNSWLTPLRLSNKPDFTHSLAQMMLSCFTAHYLVESPSHECEFFHVTGYFQTSHERELALTYHRLAHNAKRFTVFKQSNSEMSYTEDIGDLCIFVGKNEAFCLSSTMYPGLRPNSIYFVALGSGPNAGVYDIATGTIHHFPLDPFQSPEFWFAPIV